MGFFLSLRHRGVSVRLSIHFLRPLNQLRRWNRADMGVLLSEAELCSDKQMLSESKGLHPCECEVAGYERKVPRQVRSARCNSLLRLSSIFCWRSCQVGEIPSGLFPISAEHPELINLHSESACVLQSTVAMCSPDRQLATRQDPHRRRNCNARAFEQTETDSSQVGSPVRLRSACLIGYMESIAIGKNLAATNGYEIEACFLRAPVLDMCGVLVLDLWP